MKIRIKNESKAVITAFIFLFAVIYGYWHLIISPILSSWQFASQATEFTQSNSDPTFKIKEIILYSSGYADDKSKGEILRNLDLHQFTDISISIDNKSRTADLSNENTVSELYIDNIKITKNSDKGQSALNYKNPYSFGKFDETIERTDRIDFNILHTNADNESNDFSTPTFFTDCSNPITLGYLNKNVKNNSEILKSNQKIELNGMLLKLAGVPIEDMSYKLNFQIHLKNSLEESFVYTVDLDVPLKDGNSSIYDGYIFKVMHNQSKSYFFLKD